MCPRCAITKIINAISVVNGILSSHMWFSPKSTTKFSGGGRSLGSEDYESIFCIYSIGSEANGNVKPTYIKLLTESIPINFEADSGFAQAAISEKLYVKYFNYKPFFRNDLLLKYYIGGTNRLDYFRCKT